MDMEGGVFTYPQPPTVTSSPALPPQLLETLQWTLLSHSAQISPALRGPRESGRAPEPQQGLPPLQPGEFLFSWLRPVGRSASAMFSQGLSSGRKYPGAELRSLEVVRGE